jgi:hypothetical protein
MSKYKVGDKIKYKDNEQKVVEIVDIDDDGDYLVEFAGSDGLIDRHLWSGEEADNNERLIVINQVDKIVNDSSNYIEW